MTDVEKARYRATAGAVQEFGTTPQEALAALMQRLPSGAHTPIVIWPYNQGDAFSRTRNKPGCNSSGRAATR